VTVAPTRRSWPSPMSLRGRRGHSNTKQQRVVLSALSTPKAYITGAVNRACSEYNANVG